MLRFDKATYLLLLFKFISSERLSNSPWETDVVLSRVHKYSCIFCYTFTYLPTYLFIRLDVSRCPQQFVSKSFCFAPHLEEVLLLFQCLFIVCRLCGACLFLFLSSQNKELWIISSLLLQKCPAKPNLPECKVDNSFRMLP